MAIDLKYGHVPIEGIPGGEPVFILRAQDKAAILTLFAYKENARRAGSPDELIQGVEKVEHAFMKWQADNQSKLKAAD